MAKSVKLADIAGRLNISTVTVSKALSDQKGVSEEMRGKIKALAREMGYVPLSAARAAKAKKSWNIGVIVSERYLDQQESFYWKMYQEVATRAIERDCFTMLEILSRESEQGMELPRLLAEGRADGLIIIGLLKEEYFETVRRSMKIPLVCLDFYDKRQECDAVITDNYYGMYKLTNYLFEMGHIDIGYVGTLLYTGSINDRYFGYCKALLEHGRRAREDWVLEDRSVDTGCRAEGFQFQFPVEMPTAFVCNCDMTAALLVAALREKGYRVPEDISVAGFDNYLYPGICSLGITTYEVDIKEMARKALGRLIKRLSGEGGGQGVSIVEGHMVLKESIARRAESADGGRG
ncbi:MAG: LacI family DNA-binding transcriptional regulator [Clostridium sp.]|nr:LacI family DNA-binding transcriptional regulator [Clostridium sp.]